jgi:hypothetical protein
MAGLTNLAEWSETGTLSLHQMRDQIKKVESAGGDTKGVG